ncbi:MAG: NAD(P)H-binding protein [Myxococcota bacterium]
MDVGFTGATGKLGTLIGRELAKRGLPHRAFSRSPEKIPVWDQREALRLDFDDTEALKSGFKGLKRLFLISTPDSPAVRMRRHGNAIEAARAAGVEHTIFLSIRDASPDSPFPFAVANYDSERRLRAAVASDWTILRPNLYAESIVSMGGKDIEEERITFPWPGARVGYVARIDIARVAAGLLQNGGARGAVLDVTGPEALTLSEVAKRLAAIGHTVRVEPMPLDSYTEQLTGSFPPDTVAAFSGLCRALAEGRFDVTSDTVETYGGQPATRLEQVLASELTQRAVTR